MGATYCLMGHFDKAAQHYRAALQLAPDERDARLGQARAARGHGGYSTALNALNRLVQDDPGDIETLVELAHLHQRLRRSRARPALLHVLELDSARAEALDGLRSSTAARRVP